jgi:predicted nucleic acid-binding protein
LKLAYVDTSVVVGITFGETAAARLSARLARFDRIFSSNLLEAEFRSALLRERIEGSGQELLGFITWIFPNRPLSREIDRIAGAGYLRGADLWHLANALFLAPDPRELSFLTLDQRQREVAAGLGFRT